MKEFIDFFATIDGSGLLEGRFKIYINCLFCSCVFINRIVSGTIFLKTNVVTWQGESGREQAKGGGSKGGETKCLVSPGCRPLLPGLVRQFSFRILHWLSLSSFQEVQRHPMSISRTCFPCFPPSPLFVQIHTFYSGGWNKNNRLDLNCPNFQSHIVFLPFIRMLKKVDFTSPKHEVTLQSNKLQTK